MDLVVTENHRIEIKESKVIQKYLNHVRELKKPWKVTVISVVLGALGTVSKGLEKIAQSAGAVEYTDCISAEG